MILLGTLFRAARARPAYERGKYLMGTSEGLDVERLMRRHLVKVATYSGVDPSEELARQAGIPPEEVIRLNANENPFGTSAEVAGSLRDLALHVYPDRNQRRVREALSSYTGQPFERVLAGAGGDELIDLLIRLFLESGERALDCDPTFGMYSFCARISDARVVSIPRGERWEIDVDAIDRAADEHTKIVFIASPNNPTGNSLPEADARRLLRTGMIVVADETYHEFAGYTLAPLLREYENLVIVRSLSKWAGIAGLRVGYMLASPVIVSHLIDIKQPYNISVAAEAAVLAALGSTAPLLTNVRVLVEQRKRMEHAIDDIDGVSYYPSSGNFLLCRFDRRDAKSVYEDLARRGLFVRYFSHPRLQDSLRISAGTPDETGRLIEGLRQVV